MNKPTPNDPAEIIYAHLPQAHYALGVQVNAPRGNGDASKLERYAIIISPDHSRAGIVHSLRRLADAVERAEGGVVGENMLLGHELNRSEFPNLPPRDPRDPHDIHTDDFKPAGYRAWQVNAMRMLDELTRTRPTCLR